MQKREVNKKVFGLDLSPLLSLQNDLQKIHAFKYGESEFKTVIEIIDGKIGGFLTYLEYVKTRKKAMLYKDFVEEAFSIRPELQAMEQTCLDIVSKPEAQDGQRDING